MFKVPFKCHPGIVTDPKAYPWQIPANKYYVDWKLVAEDMRYGGFENIDQPPSTVERANAEVKK